MRALPVHRDHRRTFAENLYVYRRRFAAQRRV